MNRKELSFWTTFLKENFQASISVRSRLYKTYDNVMIAMLKELNPEFVFDDLI